MYTLAARPVVDYTDASGRYRCHLRVAAPRACEFETEESQLDFFVIIAVLAGVAMVAGAIGFVVWYIRN